MRAADYDDWVTETITKNGKLMHGINGDILVWNPVTRRRHDLTIGGGIGRSRNYMLLLRTAHLGEVSVTVWPQILKAMCAERKIHVLE